MASVTLKNIKKVYPFNGDDAKKKKKKKGEEPAKKTNLQITDEGVVAVQAFNLDIKDSSCWSAPPAAVSPPPCV